MDTVSKVVGLGCIAFIALGVFIFLAASAFKPAYIYPAPSPYSPTPYNVPQVNPYTPSPNDKWIPNPYYVPQRPGEQGQGSHQPDNGSLGSKGAKESK